MECAFGDQPVNMCKNRTKIGCGLTDQLELRHIVGQFACIGDAFVRAELVIALQNAQVDVTEKALAVLQQCVGVGQKAAHQLARGRHRGIDRNDKILDLAGLARFERFDQRHVAEMPQTIGIVAVIERVRINGNLFPQGGEAAQKGAVINRAAGGNCKLFAHGVPACRLIGKNGLHSGLGALGAALPLLFLFVIAFFGP